MEISQIIDELNNTSEWIDGVCNSEDREQEHIQDMFKGIEEAISLLRFVDGLSTNGRDLSINNK
jgi:hypothetical protein